MAAAAAAGPRLDDPYDEAQLAAFEHATRVSLGDLELHRVTRCCTCPASTSPATSGSTRRSRSGTPPAPRTSPVAGGHRCGDRHPGPAQRAGRPALADGVRGLAAGIPATAERPGQAGRAGRPHPAGGAHRPGGRRRRRATPRSGARSARRADEQRRRDARGPGPAQRAGRRRARPALAAAGRELRADRPGQPRAGGGPRPGPRSSRCRRRHRGRPRRGRSGPSRSPGTGTWCPTTTASAGSGWPPSRGAGPWR